MKIPRPESKQPIPSHATRVFKGIVFDVYHWEQTMFDGSTATFEKVKKADTTVVFPVLPDGRILLTKQEQPGKPPFIAGAGGRMEEGEEPEASARREMLEETGYEAEKLVLWYAEQPMSKIDWAVYVFIAHGAKKAADLNLDSGEKIELYPVTFDEFLTIGIQDNFAEKEIVPLIYAARADSAKKEELRKLFQS
ncbi:MAG: NUDIX hydrolase [Minisyncoccia bacterium]